MVKVNVASPRERYRPADPQALQRRPSRQAKLGRRLSAQDVVADFADNLARLDFHLGRSPWKPGSPTCRLAALGKHPVAAGALGFTTERVLTMERVRGIHRHRRDLGQVRRCPVRSRLYQIVRGGLRLWAAVPRRPAPGNASTSTGGPHRVLRLHGPHRSAPAENLREALYALLVKKDPHSRGRSCAHGRRRP